MGRTNPLWLSGAPILAFVLALCLAPTEASAQQGQPHQPEGYVQQPPPPQPYGQQAPPPGYGPQAYPQQYPQPYPQQPYAQPYGQPYPPQPQYVERTTTLKALWIPGIIILPVSYVMTWTIALTDFAGEAGVDYIVDSFIPIAGPWLMLGDSDTGGQTSFALAAGIVQTGALIMIIAGLAIRDTVRVPARSEDGDRSPRFHVDLMPSPGGAQLGLTLTHF